MVADAARYDAFITTLRGHFADAKILITTSPMVGEASKMAATLVPEIRVATGW